MTTPLVSCKGTSDRGVIATPVHPAGFERTLRVIQTLNGMPRSGCGTSCGHITTDILTAHNAAFPDNVIDLTEMTDILFSGAKYGVFTRTRIDEDTGEYAYIVYTSMATANPKNGVFVALAYQPDPSLPRPGYLPAGYNEGYQRNPYGVAGSSNYLFGPSGGGPLGTGGGASNVDTSATCASGGDLTANNISFV